MRKMLTNLLFLILAANGIACACPSIAVDVATHEHAAHFDDDLSAETCHGVDCDGNCDNLSNVQVADEAAPSIAGRNDFDLDDLPALPRQYLIHDLRRSPGTTPNPSRASREPFVRTSPVSLSDRMLD